MLILYDSISLAPLKGVRSTCTANKPPADPHAANPDDRQDHPTFTKVPPRGHLPHRLVSSGRNWRRTLVLRRSVTVTATSLLLRRQPSDPNPQYIVNRHILHRERSTTTRRPGTPSVCTPNKIHSLSPQHARLRTSGLRPFSKVFIFGSLFRSLSPP